jgi:hypothetical protein
MAVRRYSSEDKELLSESSWSFPVSLGVKDAVGETSLNIWSPRPNGFGIEDEFNCT